MKYIVCAEVKNLLDQKLKKMLAERAYFRKIGKVF